MALIEFGGTGTHGYLQRYAVALIVVGGTGTHGYLQKYAVALEGLSATKYSVPMPFSLERRSATCDGAPVPSSFPTIYNWLPLMIYGTHGPIGSLHWHVVFSRYWTENDL